MMMTISYIKSFALAYNTLEALEYSSTQVLILSRYQGCPLNQLLLPISNHGEQNLKAILVILFESVKVKDTSVLQMDYEMFDASTGYLPHACNCYLSCHCLRWICSGQLEKPKHRPYIESLVWG